MLKFGLQLQLDRLSFPPRSRVGGLPYYELIMNSLGGPGVHGSHHTSFGKKIRIFSPSHFLLLLQKLLFYSQWSRYGKIWFFGGNIISELKLWHFLFKKSSENYFLTILLPQCAWCVQACVGKLLSRPIISASPLFPWKFRYCKTSFFAELGYFIFSNIQNVPSSDWPAIPPRDSKNGMWLTRTKSKRLSLETPPHTRFFRWFFFDSVLQRSYQNCN